LTPAVELRVAANDTSGTATLTWTTYDGETAFGEYLVLRQIFDRVSADTLARLSRATVTSFIDSTLDPNTAYLYRISVVNGAGLEEGTASDRWSCPPHALPN
jgi:hypothetical protein